MVWKKSFWEAISFSFGLFIFPQYCIHCFYRLQRKECLFCLFCWREIDLSVTSPQKQKRYLTAEVFAYAGPLLPLVAGLKKYPFFQEELFPYYLLRLHTLKWKRPDLILYDPSLALLGKKIALQLKKPCFLLEKAPVRRTFQEKALFLLLVNERVKDGFFQKTYNHLYKVNYLLYLFSY